MSLLGLLGVRVIAQMVVVNVYNLCRNATLSMPVGQFQGTMIRSLLSSRPNVQCRAFSEVVTSGPAAPGAMDCYVHEPRDFESMVSL